MEGKARRYRRKVRADHPQKSTLTAISITYPRQVRETPTPRRAAHQARTRPPRAGEAAASRAMARAIIHPAPPGTAPEMPSTARPQMITTVRLVAISSTAVALSGPRGSPAWRSRPTRPTANHTEPGM